MARGNKAPAQSGQLAWMDQVATPSGYPGIHMWIPPDGKHLYAGTASPGVVMMFSRDITTGKLALLTPSTIGMGYSPQRICGSQNGLSIYGIASGGDNLTITKRDTTTGQMSGITAPTYIATGVYPNGCCLSPAVTSPATAADLFLYVTNKNPGGAGSISIFTRDTSTTGGNVGRLTAHSTQPTIACGSQPMGIRISPNGLYLYVANGNGSSISQYTRDVTTGVLTAMSTATVAAGGFPSQLVISADGKHLYLANDSSATIQMYSIDGTDGHLTTLSPSTVPGGNGPWYVEMSKDDLSLYVACSDGQLIYQYTRDSSTGLLTAKTNLSIRSDATVVTVTGSNGPQGLCLSPDGYHLYASSGAYISQFSVKP